MQILNIPQKFILLLKLLFEFAPLNYYRVIVTHTLFSFLADKDKRTLFVRNLPWGTDEDALAEHFTGCTEVRLPKNDDGKIRGLVKAS